MKMSVRDEAAFNNCVPSLATQTPKRSVTIDDLLAWAYRQELPKSTDGLRSSVATSSAAMWEEFRILGVRVDVTNVWGCLALGFEGGDPHPDALVVARHVNALAAETLSRVDGIDLLPDPACDILHPHERVWAHAQGFRMAVDEMGMLRSSLVASIVAAAHLGRFRSVTTVEGLKRSEVRMNGTPAYFRMVDGVEVMGFDHRRRRPYPGAYRKTQLNMDLAPVVSERIEYQAWRQSLDVLAGQLNGKLEKFSVLPSRAPWTPWTGHVAASGARILPALRFPKFSDAEHA